MGLGSHVFIASWRKKIYLWYFLIWFVQNILVWCKRALTAIDHWLFNQLKRFILYCTVCLSHLWSIFYNFLSLSICNIFVVTTINVFFYFRLNIIIVLYVNMQVAMQNFQLGVVSTSILRSTSRMEWVCGVAVLLPVAPNTSHHAAVSRHTCLNTTTSAQVHTDTHNFQAVYYVARHWALVHPEKISWLLYPLVLKHIFSLEHKSLVEYPCCLFT